jgi:anti-sigma factor RsiW
MMAPDRWEMLEMIGAYAASELPPQVARQVERLILEDPQALRLAESYVRMLALLGAAGEEEDQEAPRAVVDQAIHRAAISAFFRQAEVFFAGIGRAYVDAFVHYLGLRRSDPGPAGRGI